MWVLEKELLWFLPDCVSSEWILQTEAVEKLTHGQGHASLLMWRTIAVSLCRGRQHWTPISPLLFVS